MFTQLAPPLPLHILGKGDGYALAVIDYGPEHDLTWVTAIGCSGEIWRAPNPRVRMQSNWTLGRGKAATRHAAPGTMCDDCTTGAGVPASAD